MLNAIQTNSMIDRLPAVHQGNGAAKISEDFHRVLTKSLYDLEHSQTTVHKLNEQFLHGELPDTHQLMIAAQKATLGLELTVQVRNKAVEAYQEIMRIQI